MFNITNDNAKNYDFSLSDGTPVVFVEVTSKDNIQVVLPKNHPDANGDRLKIFRRDGSHYKDELDITLIATPRAASADDNDNEFIVRNGIVYFLERAGTPVA